MRDIRVFTDQPLTTGEKVTLDTIASRHLATVLRLKAGDPISLFNGQGGEFLATLNECNSKQVTASITDFTDTERESPLHIHLGIGMSRGDRMDWIIQKATEVGVTEISPLYTERTEVKLKGDRAEKKLRHWQQVSISACEQSYRNRVPVIHPPIAVNQWLSSVEAEKKLVLHHRSQHSISELGEQQTASAALLIGPEGGLSTDEIKRAEEHCFMPLALGPRVLRTETAPVVAISILQSLWGDFL
ncbi:MAG: 16S rRNA (uracil(1498)-N(3))-methyltransferase [Porticoccus sp.]|nr:16S rRNA (uracil(1498)-N(3))-methyltransferase [Porticoccus sp.]MBQ0808359.1 16S rRNA (uracil(1498)-N(3))-methyltransferase [Porticoccus sp.]